MRCQRWSRTLHRQDLAIAASLGIGHTGSPSQTLGAYQPSVQVEVGNLEPCGLASGDDDQDDEEPGPVASSTSDATGRDTAKHPAFRFVVSVLLRKLADPSANSMTLCRHSFS
jgi:hypothetical protein